MDPARFRKFINGTQAFYRRLFRLFRQPVFIILTVTGNMLVLIGSVSLYALESETNPNINSLLDTVWWAVSTITTVGYGDITPISDSGKIIGIILMILGTALFWSYTALFADALMSDDISDIEKELKRIEAHLKKLNPDNKLSENDLKYIISELRTGVKKH